MLVLASLLVSCLTGGAVPAAVQAPDAPAPALRRDAGRELAGFLLAEMELRARGSGRWIADNAHYKNDKEPYDQYGVEWKWGLGRRSLTGRLFGLIGGREKGTFWEFRLFWDAGRGAAILEQWGTDGTYGEGELRSLGPGRTDLVQVFRSPGRPEWATRHLTTMAGDEERGESQRLEGGAWKPDRRYVWRRSSS